MEQLKQKYNENLKRINKAFEYFDRTDISAMDKEKQIERFNKLIEEQNELMNVIGLQSGQIEVMEGFEIEVIKGVAV